MAYAKFAVSIKGGLSLGFGSIGLVRFLQENNIKPTVFAGSSSGAMVATMWAMNFPWKKIYASIQYFSLFKTLSLKSLAKEGSLVERAKYGKIIEGVIGDIGFDDIPNKLVVFATDPNIPERVSLDKGSVVSALMASSSYPPLFPIVKIKEYGNKPLIDGDLSVGYSANFLKKYDPGVEKVIGIRHRPLKSRFDSSLNFIERALVLPSILSREIEKYNDESDSVDYEIDYSAKGFNRFRFKDIDKLIDRAYQEVKRDSEILRILEK